MEQTLLPLIRPLEGPRRSPGQERRRLAARDRLSVRLAELESIRDILVRAAVRVQAGWCQEAWTSSSEGVCLVSAIRVSGPGPTAQVVSRAVDLTWHTLYDDSVGVGRVPPPDVRLARVRDLARWNDRSTRRLPEVVGLLEDASGLASQEAQRLRCAASVAPSS